MRGLAVIFRCINYMANSLGKVKTTEGTVSVFCPDYLISRACHRLEGNGFCLFGKQHKSDSLRSCTGGKRYRDAKATIFWPQ